jgi:CRISPR-associated protein Cas4
VELAMIDEVTVNRWILKALTSVYPRPSDPNIIYVTEACSPCLRKAYFDRVKPPTPSPSEFIKLVGDEAHRRILDVLKEEGYQVEVPIKLQVKNITILGRIDAAKTDDDDHHVIEFKVVEDVPDKPYGAHLMQLNLYLLAMRVKRGYLVYISRKNGKVKVFKHSYERELAKEAIMRAIKLSEALAKREPPQPEPGPWCNTCPYSLSCRKPRNTVKNR